MRIFTGIALNDEARKRVLDELPPFKKAGPSIRWTEERNIHLTLKFIGEVDAPLAEEVGAVLAAAPAASSFRLALRGFGKFPTGDDLHVFWAGVEESPELSTLFSGMEDALAPLGIARDARPFHPHVTLGRCAASRSNRPHLSSARGNTARFDFRPLFALLAETRDLLLGEWAVHAFQLFSSRLTPSGPVYSVIKEIPLVPS